MTSPKSRDIQNSAPNQQRLLKSLGCIGGIGLLSSGSLVGSVALAGESFAPRSSHGAKTDLPQFLPGQLLAQALPEEDAPTAAPEVAPEPVVEAPVYEPDYEAVVPEPASANPPEPPAALDLLPAPQIEAPVVNLTPADLGPPAEESYAGGSSAVIDNSDLYSTGATNQGGGQQLEQPAVVITERQAPPAQSCQQTLETNGLNCDATPTLAQPKPAASGVATEKPQPVANQTAKPGQQTATNTPGKASSQGGTGNSLPTVVLSSGAGAGSSGVGRSSSLPAPQTASTTQLAGNASSSNGYSVTFPSKIQNPLQFAVQSLGRSFAQSVDAASYYARTQRPAALPGNGDRSLLFPLAIPSPISSVFGWRMHPIHNTWRFHSGTDFAAEQGTPIVAPLSGMVSTADFVGGYGLTVTIDHPSSKSQTLFGHMSEIFVKPGQYVRQGEVIGRVGSTGYSTGPHLHFEVRQQDASGAWVAIDPARYLEGSVAQLMNVLRNEPLQLSPIPLAQSPFKIKPSLSTGLLPLLQKQQDQAPAPDLAVTNPVVAATPLERVVVQVVKSLEAQPNSRNATAAVRRQASLNRQPFAATAIPQAEPNVVPPTNNLSALPQPPQKLSQLPQEQR